MQTLLKELSLTDLQEWMRWVITHPSGPYQALNQDPVPERRFDPTVPFDLIEEETPAQRDPLKTGRFLEPLPRRLNMISQKGGVRAEERLSVYSDAYFYRLLECLSDDFRTVAGVLDGQLFRQLVADYLMRYPSTSYTVGELGHALPRFLLKHSLATEFPFIADLARLEWNVLRSLYAERLPNLDTNRIAEVPLDSWPSARMELDPTVRLLGTEWPVDLLWEDRFVPEPYGRRTLLQEEQRWLVVYRDEWMNVRAIDGAQWFALERISEGCTLGHVCDDLQTLFSPSGEPLPIMQWFAQWIADGWIKKFSFFPD